MNEPSVFNTPVKTMPLDVVHNVEGRLTDHREIHNVFGMENVHATYDGMLKLRPNERPFVLTRAGFAGAERYAATWTGDNTATFDHMRISIPQLINLGLSGYAFVGADIGGFNGSATPELLTRWMELGAFNPIYRNHAAKETRFREPWVDGPVHEAIHKRYIETRYRLLPYIYTAMEQNSRDGVPLMRPMFMEFPDDPALLTNGEEYMFGDDLLVAPRVWNFVGNYNIVLPKGDWFDYWTGTRIAGDRTIAVDPPMETLPVYVRGGSIIPQQPVIQYVGQIPNGPLELHVYPGPNCAGDLYVDDGNTFNYQRGESTRYHFSCTATGNSVEVTADAPKGTYQPWFHQYRVTIHGVTGKASVTIDGQATADLQQTDNSVTLPGVSASGAHTIRVTF